MNPFVLNPLKIIIYDPVSGKNIKTYVVLGDIPENVRNAVKSPNIKSNESTLKNFYGSNFKQKLFIGDKKGGASDYLDIDIDEDFLKEESEIDTKEVPTVDYTPGVEYISGNVYPEDKFWELKEKIFMFTNIPVYRQHIMFHGIDNELTTIYKLFLEGIYDTDIRMAGKKGESFISNMPIDQFLYNSRDDVKIEAYDSFRIIKEIVSNPIIYVVDINMYTSKNRIQMMEIVQDKYQLDLLYYGFVIKYWPVMTPEIFVDYIKNESDMQNSYPDLARPTITLKIEYTNEAKIMNKLYKNYSKVEDQMKKMTTAVTRMISTVTEKTFQVNIRNLFDKIHVSDCIPEIRAIVIHNGNKYRLVKKSSNMNISIPFPTEAKFSKSGLTMAIMLKKGANFSLDAPPEKQYKFIKSTSIIENEQSKYLFFNIQPNGLFFVKSIWNEEDFKQFDSIVETIKKYTDNLISAINGYGKYIIPSSDTMDHITSSNIVYNSLNMSIIWKKTMSDAMFKEFKNMMSEYISAGIITAKGIQSSDSYEIKFKKGMFEFDINQVEKVLKAAGADDLRNHYSYMVNPLIKQKWDQSYEGRVVKIYHRTTDIKFEAIGVTKAEFENLFKLLANMIINATSSEKIIKASEAEPRKQVKKLKKLKEIDPELYNLKKHGSKKVYSIICQNKNQPAVYTEDDIKKLSAEEKKKLIKYWNFTMNKEIYYSCPTKKYPYLSFKIGKHPKGYCLPCCKKNPEDPTIMDICVKEKKYEDKKEKGFSRHIMKYSKGVEFGRLTELPGPLYTLLTMGIKKEEYVIFGMHQHFASIGHVGILHTLSHALDISVTTLINKFITSLKDTLLFQTVMGGQLIDYYENNDELIEEMRDIFINQKLLAISNFDKWNDLFIELSWRVLSVIIVQFIDQYGRGDTINLNVESYIAKEIIQQKTGEKKNTSFDYVLVSKRINLFNPIYIIDEKYITDQKVAKKKYKFEDSSIQRIVTILQDYDSDIINKVDQPANLEIVVEVAHENGYKVVKKYINNHNLCYAILLEKAGDKIYCPVTHSVYTTDSTIEFNSFCRKGKILKYSALMKFVDLYNANVKKNHKIKGGEDLYQYKLIAPDEYLRYNNKLIGFRAQKMSFYFTDDLSLKGGSEHPIRDLMYDPDDINRSIAEREKYKPDNRVKLLSKSLYEYNIYQLFIMEFVNYMESERNTNVRNMIKQAMGERDYSKKILDTVREISDSSDDIILLRNKITKLNKKDLAAYIEKKQFDFDKIKFKKLKELSKEDMIKELQTLSKNFAIEGKVNVNKLQFPNIYMPCEYGDTEYCSGKKLIVNDLDAMIDLLATDLKNPIREKYILSGIFVENIIEYFRFDTKPFEIITVTQI